MSDQPTDQPAESYTPEPVEPAPADSPYPPDYQPTDKNDPAPADSTYGPDYVAPSSQDEADPEGPDTAAEVVEPTEESGTVTESGSDFDRG